MPKTVLQTIDRAMHKAKVKALGVTLSDELKANCIEELNDIMFQLAADGVHLGYTEVSTETDMLTVPFYANGFVASYLAYYICTEAGVQPPATLMAQLEEQRRVIEKNAIANPKIYYPSTLPTGGSDAGFYAGGAYFGDQLQDAHTTESGDYIKDERGRIIGIEEIEEDDGDTL